MLNEKMYQALERAIETVPMTEPNCTLQLIVKGADGTYLYVQAVAFKSEGTYVYKKILNFRLRWN